MPNTLSQTAAHSPIGPGMSARLELVSPNIYLTSELNPDWILGRPIVCGLTDDWGRFFYSATFTFDNPGWLFPAIALEAALANKVDYCAQSGVEIPEDEWPVEFLPQAVGLDQDIAGLLPDSVTSGLGISVNVTPPSAPYLRSVLERNCPLLNNQVIEWRPLGNLPAGPIEAGLSRSSVLLTRREFQALLIRAVLHHHRSILRGYRVTPEMTAAGVQPCPLELLKWSMANRSGLLQFVSLAEARLHLLPRNAGHLTRRGIKYRGLYYTCARAIREKWFESVRRYGSFQIEVAYDPRLVDRIFLVPKKKGAPAEPCDLVPADRTFCGFTWAEVFAWHKQQRMLYMESVHPAKNNGGSVECKPDSGRTVRLPPLAD